MAVQRSQVVAVASCVAYLARCRRDDLGGRHGRIELRIFNWAIVFVVSIALVSAGIWAGFRRQPR